MKTAVGLLVLGLPLNSSFGQGHVAFSNIGGTTSQRVTIYTPNGPVYAPPGNTYSIGLYWAPDGTTDASMFTLLGPSTGLRSGVGGAATGLYDGGSRTIPVTSGGPGGYAMLQVRGWTTAYGSSFEQAIASGQPGDNLAGVSSIFRADTGNFTLPTPEPASRLVDQGLTGLCLGYDLTCIPEPSSVAVGLLGIAALLLMHWRMSVRS